MKMTASADIAFYDNPIFVLFFFCLIWFVARVLSFGVSIKISSEKLKWNEVDLNKREMQCVET